MDSIAGELIKQAVFLHQSGLSGLLYCLWHYIAFVLR